VNIDDYLQDRETVYCQTETQHGSGPKGTLACTDSRLVFVRDKSVVDIQLRSIEEIVFEPKPIKWLYVIFGTVFLVAGLLSSTVISSMEGFMGVFGGILGPIFIVFAVAMFLLVAYYYKATLTVHTGSNKREFRSGELADFPHAIRGAAN